MGIYAMICLELNFSMDISIDPFERNIGFAGKIYMTRKHCCERKKVLSETNINLALQAHINITILEPLELSSASGWFVFIQGYLLELKLFDTRAPSISRMDARSAKILSILAWRTILSHSFHFRQNRSQHKYHISSNKRLVRPCVQ